MRLATPSVGGRKNRAYLALIFPRKRARICIWFRGDTWLERLAAVTMVIFLHAAIIYFWFLFCVCLSVSRNPPQLVSHIEAVIFPLQWSPELFARCARASGAE